MKKSTALLAIIVLFATGLKAQSGKFDDFSKQWETVEQFEIKGLPKSALAEVEKIYKKAKKTKNHPQLIKSLLYKSKFAITLEEDAQLKVINQLKKEIANNSTPTKNILESMLADLYWQYFQQNRWKFYNRTNTATKVDSVDFRTWDLQTIFEETHLQYQKSLEGALTLQQIPLKEFNSILSLSKGSKIYRPTVYDFLAHRAISFYKNDERNLNRPAYKFEIDNPQLLANNDAFVKVQLSSQDSLSQQLHALHIYKNLALFHSKDKNLRALLAVTLERLDFVRSHAVFNDIDKIYLSTLQALKEKYQNNEIVTKIDYRIAALFNQQADAYVPLEKENNRWKRKEALEICQKAIAAFPKSVGAQQCRNLQNQIVGKSIQITNEKFIPIDMPSRILITYKNTEQLYFSIRKITKKQEKKLYQTYNDSAKIAFINNLPVLTSWDAKLHNEYDYQQHRTEVLVPELSQGNYLIFASTTKDASPKHTFAYGFVQVTNLALIENTSSGKYTYQIVDRNNGKPIKNATIHLKNYDTGRYNKPYENTLVTNSKGQVSFTVNNRHSNIIATVTHGKDKAVFGDFYINKLYKPQYDTSTQATISLFTDRSIYRPGQTVYFKGIAIAKKENKSAVIENKKVTVTLKDVNYQVVKTFDLQTNEFGSFSGEFILPTSGLTGYFQITATGNTGLFNRTMNGNTSFSVEEYKRPKFETEFKPVTETYRLNDSIAVIGFAKAYAGSTITDAKVSYRVHRTAQYPKWYWYYRPQITSESQEITHGKTTTDADGNFKVVFKAIPDLSINPSTQPTFTYKVFADVTDINGETRSAETTVKVGYHALDIGISVADRLDKLKKKHTLTVTTTNLNGEFIPTQGTIKIYKLTPPPHVLRKRPWKAPDYQEFSKETFSTLFPHDAYQNEDNPGRWQKGTLVFDAAVNTKKSKEITLPKLSKWKSGAYIAVFECLDIFGQPVKDEQRFNVFSPRDNKIADRQLFTVKTDKPTYKPNELVKIQLGSASKDISITVVIEKNYRIVETKIVHLTDEIKSITVPVQEKDLGGFAIHYQFVNYNSFQSGTLAIDVPYPKQKLEIETATFRDKLQPGKEETWSFTLKGPNRDKVAAELLASMYDASLDQFKSHYWNFNPINYRYYYSRNRSNANRSFGNVNFSIRQQYKPYHGVSAQNYDRLNWFGFNFGYSRLYFKADFVVEEEIVDTDKKPNRNKANPSAGIVQGRYAEAPMEKKEAVEMDDIADIPFSKVETKSATFVVKPNFEPKKPSLEGIITRKNFQETAFFYPHLKTDAEGNVSFSFTTPESLTRWKLQLLAHTKNLASATKELSAITQKELMVLPNPPRFLREGDQITFASKIANLSDKKLNGTSQLFLYDALTNKDITQKLIKSNNNSAAGGQRGFTINAKGNTNVSWTLQIPDNVQAVKYKIVAKAGDFSDGEENTLPVLSNRMLVTETLPMWLRSNQTKTFTLEKLKNNTSTTLKNHKLTLEVTSNPAWYAIQALPYLMEYPYECSEQTFSRYYANALASHIANSNPRIQEVFKQWASTDALLSNLEKNQELKSLIIQETPWLRDAQSETEQKKRIALLFNLNKMKNELQSAARKLKQMQFSNGGFPWFKGSRYPNRYITQHIASGFGHLKKLNVIRTERGTSDEESLKKMLRKVVKFLDYEILEDYHNLEKQAKRIRESAKTKKEGAKKEAAFWAKNHTGNMQIHYLYMRSFYKDMTIPKGLQKVVDYYTNQAYTFWLNRNLYTKGMIALIAHRNGKTNVTNNVLASLKENSITSDELGMYWKSNTASWYWYQAPVETQALLIEAFSEAGNVFQSEAKNLKDIDNLKIWLLKNKQTNRWKTTKATTEAVYALLLQGTNWLKETDFVDIVIGGQKIKPLQLEDTKVEAGTGYFKTSWTGNEITPKMASVTLSKKSDGIAWGALYWQYFENLDKITTAKTPLQLKKKLFLKKNTDNGEELSEITDTTNLILGDVVRVRIELKVDRTMEFVHMKDLRAAGFEPINVLSQYKYQDGLGYYESTKDAATHFFFDYLPKGVYVFEYDLRVNNKGDFSNGITTIQSMYAPEFSSHSEGVRVKVGN
jgi:hypothetical protein